MTSDPTLRAARRGVGMAYFTKLLPMAACLAPFWLGACQEVGFDASVPPRMAPGVPIIIETVEGPPAEVQTALSGAIARAAAAHQVMVVDDNAAARFHLRGYLTAYAADDGKTALAYVWDVFDNTNHRAQRVIGVEEMAANPADPWSGIDDRELQRIATKSMDGIADFLADAGNSAPPVMTAKLSPRSVTSGAAAGAAAGAGAGPSGKPLGFAPTE
jgi:hypothetical protein